MWKFIKYRFNKAFEKNLFNLILFLLAASVIGIFIFSTLFFVLQKIGLLSEDNFFTETLWGAFGLFFDQNQILDLDVEKNNFFDFFFKFNITIFGILVFSSLIGIITNFISNKIESLRSGKTKIEEENHIVFFNFSRRLIPLISELCTGYVKDKQSFVVVTNEEPLRVIEKINNVIKIPKNITIVARKGFAWQKSLQDKLNLSKAKQLIILKPDVSETYKTELECDVEVGKSLASLLAHKEWDQNPSKVVAEFHDQTRGYLYLGYCDEIIKSQFKKMGRYWEEPNVISSSNLKNNLLSQCTNTPDLTEIYDQIFGYQGSEVYFLDPRKPKFTDILKKNWGKTIKELNTLCDNIVVIGFYLDDQRHNQSWNKLFLNTPTDFPLSENYGMICIAQDENQIVTELNNLDKQKKSVKDINPNFAPDDNDLKVVMFDYSKEQDTDYLTNIINSIIGLNYHNNLKSLKVFKHQVNGNLKDKAFLPQPPNYKILENEENHPLLGVIYHVVKTKDKQKFNFQIYSLNKNSALNSKINVGDYILNIVPTKEIAEYQGKAEDKCSYTTKVPYAVHKRFKDKVAKLISTNEELSIIVKRFKDNKIEFINFSSKEITDHKSKILTEFKELQDNRKNMINNIRENVSIEEKDLDNLTKEMNWATVQEYEKDNCYVFFNETNQQIQKFRENPTEDHVMINNFIGFSNLKNHNKKMADHSMITEINGYRTKRILEDYKSKYFSPYLGNDIVEINSIISKYLAAATFDQKNTRLIDLLFSRIHMIRAHSLRDDILKTTFCELENYFQQKNETLIGIIDYEFDKNHKRRIKKISINPNQTKEISLDQGDRAITIANFNDLEMVNQSRYLHIL